MGHIVEVVNTILDLRLVTVEEITADASEVTVLYQLLKAWAGHGEIKELRLTRDLTNLDLYAYRIERRNGLVFDSTLEFTGPDDRDPVTTVSLSPGWRLSVISPGLIVRKQLVAIRVLVGIENFEVVFA